jgi:methylase of polypeptide subunit release factors
MQQTLTWTEDGQTHALLYRTEGGNAPPKRVVPADDTLSADEAFRLASEGAALLWRGDFQNARQLLQALGRRADKPGKRKRKAAPAATDVPGQAFHLDRQAKAQRARTLGMLLIPFDRDYTIPLRRAPDVRQACTEAWGEPDAPFCVSLRELQGAIGAHEWRKKGVEVPALGARIHPHYGVFAPVRGEYVRLVAEAPLPPGAQALAFDIGTGTGVLAAVLARRGVARVIATDQQSRALACASDNLQRLGMTNRVDLLQADLFPDGRASLVVCNPPWVPARAASTLDHAVFDPDSRMLLGFLNGLAAHLTEDGEGWLILSDLAEHLGLRTRDWLLAAIAAAGLAVLGRLDTRPVHPRAADPDDPLHAARSAEVTSLWRLGRA